MRERDEITSCVEAERNTSNKTRVLVFLNEGKVQFSLLEYR